jgi:hypothetical protein
MEGYYHSKEDVKQRMFQHIISFWNVNSFEELDPVILRLIEGIASEIYTLNHTLSDSKINLLESLAKLLTPSVHSFPKPAHGIAKATTVEPFCHLNKNTVFQDKNISQELRKQGINTINFVPVTDIRLINGEVKYMVCERMFYRMEENKGKTLLGTAQILDERINHTIWLALDIHPENDTLKDLSFYFDFPHTDAKHEKNKLLPYTKWSYEGKEINIKSGLPIIDNHAVNKASIFYKYELLNQIDEQILSLYKNQFVTIHDDLHPSDLSAQKIPKEIEDMFPDKINSSLTPCIWIKITFPPPILAVDLYNLMVSINAFPVVNKIPRSVIYKRDNLTGIMPLRTGKKECFLAVEQVVDSHGTNYYSIPYTTEDNRESGVYTLKQGSSERFDNRDAKIYLERLLDLLRSESTSFSSMGTDNIRNIVSRLESNMKAIKEKYKNSQMDVETAEIPYYLLLNTVKPDDIIFVDFWSTNAELANGIHSGRILTPETFLPLDKNGCKLIKITSGGKSAPDVTGKLAAYRYALTSRDQIVTRHDIINFFKMELGNNLMNIEVKRGVCVSSKPKEGMIRTTDIFLSVTPDYQKIINEMKDDLLTTLESKAPDLYNFRIIIN